jgi:hypothetical protein
MIIRTAGPNYTPADSEDCLAHEDLLEKAILSTILRFDNSPCPCQSFTRYFRPARKAEQRASSHVANFRPSTEGARSCMRQGIGYDESKSRGNRLTSLSSSRRTLTARRPNLCTRRCRARVNGELARRQTNSKLPASHDSGRTAAWRTGVEVIGLKLPSKIWGVGVARDWYKEQRTSYVPLPALARLRSRWIWRGR